MLMFRGEEWNHAEVAADSFINTRTIDSYMYYTRQKHYRILVRFSQSRKTFQQASQS